MRSMRQCVSGSAAFRRVALCTHVIGALALLSRMTLLPPPPKKNLNSPTPHPKAHRPVILPLLQTRVWPLLGVSPSMHNSCFAWIHFRQVSRAAATLSRAAICTFSAKLQPHECRN